MPPPMSNRVKGHFIIKQSVSFDQGTFHYETEYEFERAKFNMKVQREREPVDNFITDL